LTDEPEQSAGLDLQHLLSIARRRAWVVIVCTIAVGAIAFAISKSETKKYTATAGLLFRNPDVAQQASGVQVSSGGASDAVQQATNLKLLSAQSVAVATAQALGGNTTPGEVKGAISISSEGTSDVVSISAEATTPQRAAQIANTYTRTFIKQQRANDQATIESGIRLVQQQYLGQTPAQQRSADGQALNDRIESLKVLKAMQVGNTRIVEQAIPPGGASSPNLKKNTGIGIVLGFLLGIALVVVIERLDRRLRDPRDAEKIFRAPTLSVIPHGHWDPSTNGSGRPQTVPELEPFVTLRANLRYFSVSREIRGVLVTSAIPSEGKTTTAWSLAAAGALMGNRTLLIEADLRRPSLSAHGLAPGPGLSGLLTLDMPYEECVESVTVGEGSWTSTRESRTLDILVAGAIPPNPAELLESEAMSRLLTWAEENYELVVVDTPPLSIVADAVPLIKQVDGVIVVSRLGRGTRAWIISVRRCSASSSTTSGAATAPNTTTATSRTRRPRWHRIPASRGPSEGVGRPSPQTTP
jgi:capsular exopolysaccharide synthesis family protein